MRSTTPSRRIRRINATVDKSLGNPPTIGQFPADGSAPISSRPDPIAAFVPTAQAGLRRVREPLPLLDPTGRPIGFIDREVKDSKRTSEAKDKT
jgi:hypothetical protein